MTKNPFDNVKSDLNKNIQHDMKLVCKDAPIGKVKTFRLYPGDIEKITKIRKFAQELCDSNRQLTNSDIIRAAIEAANSLSPNQIKNIIQRIRT